MTEEYDYFTNRRTDRVYISKSFPSWKDGRKMRFIHKAFDSEQHRFARIRDEIVVQVTNDGKWELKAMFYEDTRDIQYITIQRFTKDTGSTHKHSFTLRGEEIIKLYNLLRSVKHFDLTDDEKQRLDDDILDELLISVSDKKQFILQNWDSFSSVLEHDLTSTDIISLGYRKHQLEIFEQLLCDPEFFERTQQEWNRRGKEAVWQKFFEDNPWIFGYGLNYIFTSQLDGKKLEQVTTGYSIQGSGKRVDALMKTRGYISSLCFVEIKTHETPLIYQKQPYRSDCWRVSDELMGSISQIQKTVQKAVKSLETKVVLKNDRGDPTGEMAFLYEPKSYVVIGCQDEFVTDNGVNEAQFSSFELFRRSIRNPEIITFDELYQRAKFIVQHHESSESETEVREMEPTIEEEVFPCSLPGVPPTPEPPPWPENLECPPWLAEEEDAFGPDQSS